MKSIIQIIVGVLIIQLIAVIVATPTKVLACSCDSPVDAIDGLEKSDAVFTGKVKKLKKVMIEREAYDAVLIEVEEIWKGIKESQVIIYTDWSSCQFDFQEEEEYLLYTYKSEDKSFVMNCGRSTTISNGEEDIKLLSSGEEPSIDVDLTFQFNKRRWITGSIFAVIIASAIALLIRKHMIRKYKYRNN